jgi:multicomponent K+:H+ antiporter subunit E
MNRWLPYPLVSFALFAVWLLLNESVSTGHIVLGAVLAVGGGLALTALEPPRLRLRRPAAIVELSFLVLMDIIRSNIAVARIIFAPGLAHETAGFMTIPLEMRAPYGLTALAIIITSTPGTLWVSFDSNKGLLTIHVLDLIDENAWIATIKGRYERRLMEIFE